MEKIYTKKNKEISNFSPKKKVKDFILNYSKALRVYDCNGLKIELLVN